MNNNKKKKKDDNNKKQNHQKKITQSHRCEKRLQSKHIHGIPKRSNINVTTLSLWFPHNFASSSHRFHNAFHNAFTTFCTKSCHLVITGGVILPKKYTLKCNGSFIPIDYESWVPIWLVQFGIFWTCWVCLGLHCCLLLTPKLARVLSKCRVKSGEALSLIGCVEHELSNNQSGV